MKITHLSENIFTVETDQKLTYLIYDDDESGLLIWRENGSMDVAERRHGSILSLGKVPIIILDRKEG